MAYEILKDLLPVIEQFESEHIANDRKDFKAFKKWAFSKLSEEFENAEDLTWEGMHKGRSIESLISTLISRMGRFGKYYSKAAIHNSQFSTQEEFIYLIELKAKGKMTKTELIKINIHDKPMGMQIIQRLLMHGWITEQDSKEDKRKKIIEITENGERVLSEQMPKIRRATKIVTGNLTEWEKLTFAHLLLKLNDFHEPIFQKGLHPDELIEDVLHGYPFIGKN